MRGPNGSRLPLGALAGSRKNIGNGQSVLFHLKSMTDKISNSRAEIEFIGDQSGGAMHRLGELRKDTP
jgi:hypothetical protein